MLIAIIGEVTATSALKASSGFTKIFPSIIVLIGYGVSFLFLSLTLKSIALGVTYAVWAGIGIVLVSIVGLVFYKQTLDLPAIIGIILIIAGVITINLFSKSISH